MVRRLSIGKNNHLTCYSLAINPRYVYLIEMWLKIRVHLCEYFSCLPVTLMQNCSQEKESLRGALFAEVNLILSTNAGPEEKVGGGGGGGEAEELGEYCDGSQCYTLSVCFHCRCSSK